MEQQNVVLGRLVDYFGADEVLERFIEKMNPKEVRQILNEIEDEMDESIREADEGSRPDREYEEWADSRA